MSDVLRIKVNDAWEPILALKGNTGPQGPQGEVGPIGPQGPTDVAISATTPTHNEKLWVDTTDIRTFAEVAFSGDYDDLSDKPSIPSVSVSDTGTATDTVQYITINGVEKKLAGGGGGGGSYTAGDGIEISASNVISLDKDIEANTIQLGDDSNNYFQCRKFRGEGTASSYYHAVDFGYAGHNQVDFYDYGGTYTFYECTNGNPSNAVELLKVTPSAITYKGNSIQNYTAGSNITIANGVISATNTTYTAGTGISISNGVISCTFPNGDGVSY